MHITELRIRNFRNFRKAKFVFEPGVNTLLGENGAGKSNALHALRLLLDESLERNSIYLREADFCRGNGAWRGHWIVVAADFAQLDPSEGCQLLKHTAGHMDGTASGTCTYYFRPKPEVRKRLYELTGNPVASNAYVASLTIEHYEPVLTGRARGDFLDDLTYQKCVGDLSAGAFPNPEDDDTEVLGVRMRPVYEEVACTFVRALRDVGAELRSYRANPLLALLRGMETTIKIADATRIADRVKELNGDISGLTEIKDLATGIESALTRAVGYTYGPTVSIESALPDAMERLLQRLSVLVGERGGSAYRGEVHEQGLGAANLIYLALKLLEYELKLSSDRVAHFFLIEEPEAHIHTHIQRTLFSNLPSQRTQVIVSTHSTHVSSASRVASVNVLAKVDDHAEVYQPANGLTPEQRSRLERYLDAVRSTLLFAKGVLLVEGDAEQLVIPAMLRCVFGVSPDELGFSVISMSCSFFEHVATVFSQARIKRPCAILTDLDLALCSLPENSDADSKEQARARASQAAGEQRRRSLMDFQDGNRWVRAFFAEYTFEVDFIRAGNAPETVRTLDSIYAVEGSKQKSTERLKSPDVQVSGTEILRLAEKCGKGWFALLLSEKLDSRTLIPDYILRAVAFACSQSVSDLVLKRVVEFRLQTEAARDFVAAMPSAAELMTLTPAEVVARYRTVAETDSLSRFCQYVAEFRQA